MDGKGERREREGKGRGEERESGEVGMMYERKDLQRTGKGEERMEGDGEKKKSVEEWKGK